MYSFIENLERMRCNFSTSILDSKRHSFTENHRLQVKVIAGIRIEQKYAKYQNPINPNYDYVIFWCIAW